MVCDENVYKSQLTLDLKASGSDIAKALDFATNPHRAAAGKLDLFSDGRPLRRHLSRGPPPWLHVAHTI